MEKDPFGLTFFGLWSARLWIISILMDGEVGDWR